MRFPFDGYLRSGTGSRWLSGALGFGFWLLWAGSAWATTTINESFTPAVIDQGDNSLYTITVTNDSIELTDARVTVFLDTTEIGTDPGTGEPIFDPDSSDGWVTIADGAVQVNSCGFTVDAADPGTSKIVLSGGTIPAGSLQNVTTCSFALHVTSTKVDTFHAYIPEDRGVTPDADTAGYEALENGLRMSNATDADVTLQVNALFPPTGAKVFSPSPAVVGDPVRLTITLTNPNAAATLPLTQFTDNLPADMVVATPANAAASCSGTGAADGTLTAVAGSATIDFTGGTIGEGGTCTLGVDLVVASIGGDSSRVFTNAVAEGAIGNSRGLTSPAFSRNVTVNSPVGVSKSFDPTTIPAGQPALMTLTISNASVTNTLPITSFTDDLSGTTLVVLDRNSAPVPAPADPAVSCDGAGASDGTLVYVPDVQDTSLTLSGAVAGTHSGSLGKCVITAYVTSEADGAHLNSIPADAVVNPAGHASPAASASLQTNAQLTVDKTVSVSNLAPGQWTEFTLTVSNYSGAQVTNVSFLDLLPTAGGYQMVVYDPGSGIFATDAGCIGGTWTGTDAAGVSTGADPVSGADAGIRWSGGTLVAGSGATPGVCTITIRAQLPAAADTGLTFGNQIPPYDPATLVGIGGENPSGGQVGNPEASPEARVTSASAVTLIKTFSPTSISQGGLSTLTLRIRNRRVTALTGVDLTDRLPAGLTLAANPAATNGCGGVLTANPLADTLSLTAGSVGPRPDASEYTECLITARVTGEALGTYTNTITPADFDSVAGTIPGDVSANLSINTGLTANKSFSPGTVTSGGTSRVTIRITNGTNGELTNVSVHDPLGADLAVANPANAASSCPGDPSLVANPGDTSADLLGATLAAGASCNFAFDVVTSGTGNWTNTLPVNSVTSAEGLYNTAAASATLSAETGAININKSFNPVIVTGGVDSILTLTLTNPTAAALHGVGVTDVFPDGIQVYSVPDAATTCAGGTVTAVAGSDQVRLEGATMAANSSCQVTLRTTSIRFLNLTNTIPAGAVESDEGYTNPRLVSATLSTLQGLGVMKAFEPAYVVPNAVTRLKMWLVSTLDPNAPSPVTLTGVSYTDTLPTGLVVASSANAYTSCQGSGAGGSAEVTAHPGSNLVTVSRATIPPNSLCSIEVDVLAPGTLGTYDNTIDAESIETDQGITNRDPAEASLHVVDLPTVAKAFDASPVNIGATSTLVVTLGNGAGVDLTGVALADRLPDGLYIATTPSAATDCADAVVTADPGGSELSITGARLPAGGSCTFRAQVTSPTGGSYPNAINAGSLYSDQGLTNPGPASATLVVRPPVSIDKGFDPVSIASGDSAILTLTLGNTSGADVTLTSALVDALPGGLTVGGGGVLAGTTCPGMVSADTGAASITYADGAIIPDGGCIIEVEVTSSTPGVYTNVIAAGQLTTTAGNNQEPAVASLGVDRPAPPTVDKVFTPDSLETGSVSTLTLTLGNPNAADLTLAADFVDTLPTGLVSNSGLPTTDCGGTASVVQPGDTTITLAAGATIPPGGCTITLDVTSAAAGGYTNSVPAGALQVDDGHGGTLENVSPATAPVVFEDPSPPTLFKGFSPGTINPGGVTTLTITLANGNDRSIAVTGFSDDLASAGAGLLAIASPANASTSCTGGTLTASAGGTLIQYSGGAIPANATCTIRVDVTSDVSGGPWTNRIPAGALTTDVGTNGVEVTAKLFVNDPQPPSLSKSFSPDWITVGGTATLSLSLGNGNASAATLTADLVDDLPADLLIATPANLQTTCPGTVTAADGGTRITYVAGSALPAGGCSIAVDVTSSLRGSYVNTLAAGALQTTAGDNAVDTTATLNAYEPPGVAIDKTLYEGHDGGAGCPGGDELIVVDFTSPPPPKDVTWCFEVTNTGGEHLTDIRITDPLLSISATAQLVLRAGSLPLAPGASATWSLDDSRTSSLENSATVEATPSRDDGTPIGQDDVTATDDAALFGYVFDPPFGEKRGVQAGQALLRWTMVWINDSPIVADDVHITDVPPAGTTYVPGSLTCSTPVGSVTTWTQCAFIAGQVDVIADLGPDAGATDAASANNELLVSFDVTVDDPNVQAVYQNQGLLEWDTDGDGAPDIVVVTDDPVPAGPADPTDVRFIPFSAIPVLPVWGLLLLPALLGLVGARRLRRPGR